MFLFNFHLFGCLCNMLNVRHVCSLPTIKLHLQISGLDFLHDRKTWQPIHLSPTSRIVPSFRPVWCYWEEVTIDRLQRTTTWTVCMMLALTFPLFHSTDDIISLSLVHKWRALRLVWWILMLLIVRRPRYGVGCRPLWNSTWNKTITTRRCYRAVWTQHEPSSSRRWYCTVRTRWLVEISVSYVCLTTCSTITDNVILLVCALPSDLEKPQTKGWVSFRQPLL